MKTVTRTFAVSLALASHFVVATAAQTIPESGGIVIASSDAVPKQPAQPYLPIQGCKNALECADTNHSATALRIAR